MGFDLLLSSIINLLDAPDEAMQDIPLRMVLCWVKGSNEHSLSTATRSWLPGPSASPSSQNGQRSMHLPAPTLNLPLSWFCQRGLIAHCITDVAEDKKLLIIVQYGG